MSETIHRALVEALGADDAERRVVVEAGPVYLVVRVDDDAITVDAPRSASLPKSHRLSTEHAHLLRGLGFDKPRPRRDFRSVRTRRAGDAGRLAVELAGQLEDILVRVYAEDSAPTARVQLDDRDPPTNPDLLDAMRDVAKPPFDHGLRIALYNALVNATFLVPLAEDGDEDEPLVLESLKDRPVWGVFSQLDELRAWRPRGWEWAALHGSELFPRAHEAGIASLRINPDGLVGGELYAHEVASLTEAVRRHRAGRRS
jgi:hypothetical protein